MCKSDDYGKLLRRFLFVSHSYNFPEFRTNFSIFFAISPFVPAGTMVLEKCSKKFLKHEFFHPFTKHENLIEDSLYHAAGGKFHQPTNDLSKIRLVQEYKHRIESMVPLERLNRIRNAQYIWFTTNWLSDSGIHICSLWQALAVFLPQHDSRRFDSFSLLVAQTN